MAVARRSTSTVTTSVNGGTSFSITWPTNAVDDVAILAVGANTPVHTPGGWEKLAEVTDNSTARLYLYWRPITAVMSGSQVVYQVAGIGRGAITVYSGAAKPRVVTSTTAFASANVTSDSQSYTGFGALFVVTPPAPTISGQASTVGSWVPSEAYDSISGGVPSVSLTDGSIASATGTLSGTLSASSVWSTAALAFDAGTPDALYDAPQTLLLNRWRAEDLGVADGASVPHLAPIAGTNILAQATSANQATMSRNVVNGKAALDWGSVASSKHYTTSMTSDAQPTSWYAVVKPDSSIGTNQHQVAHATQEAFHTESGGWKGYAGNAGWTPVGTVGTDWQVLTMVFSGGTGSLYQNGTLLKSATIGTSASGTTLNVGRHSNGTRIWRGYIAEIGRYNDALDDTTRAALHTYVQDYYGITVADYVSLDIDRARVGASIPSFRVGTSSVSKLYVGSAQIWP